MTGNVVVDDIQTEEERPGRRAPVWLLALGAVALASLFMLSRQPEALPPAPSLTIPEVIVPEDRWERLDLPGSGGLTDVTLLDGTYVAVGEGPQFWSSTDATNWNLLPSADSDPAVAAAVAGFGDRTVAVGTAWLGDGSTRATAWISFDLETWESVAPLEQGDSGLDGVVSDGEILIAWGWQGTAQPFSPAGEAVLLVSTDGLAWQEIPAPSLDARVYAVRPRPAGGWWAMGYEIGRPALWFSEDLQKWEAVPSRGLPFGWAMVDMVDPNRERLPLLATLVDVGDDRIRRWQLEPDGEWTPMGDRFGGPSRITTHHVELFGTGGGRLWVLGEDHTEWDALDVWEPLDLDGEVQAVERRVAVGMAGDRFLQPSLWVLDADTVTYSLPVVTGPGWEKVAEFGEGMYVGAWPVGSGWVVGTSETDWWFVDADGVEPIDPGWTDLWRIDPVGSEWVAIPSMLWSDDGREWEARGEVLPSLGDLLAMREDENGHMVALYTSAGWMWTVARSGDGGRSWETVSEPTASTPVWSVVPTSTGFAGAAARQRGTEEIVVSKDGVEWEDVDGLTRMLPAFQPAAMTAQGTLLLLDTGEEVEVPRQDILQVARAGEDLVLLAGGRIWVGRSGDWESFPLDVPHGLAPTSAVPIVIDGRVHVVASDGTGVAMYEWSE
ncbi:MAG TPA: hypothetical protein VLB85_11250 [Acidimicrobiia bacterium]|nr:hypothetical protein [Acidimicrobiia bacterium]